MRILDWNSLDPPARRAALARPSLEARPEMHRRAAEIIERVRREGDSALRALTQQLDCANLGALAVTRDEFAAAKHALAPDVTAALKRAIDNVQHFQASQALAPRSLEPEIGVRCDQLVRPIGRVGLYVPGGTAPLPSTVIMLAIPARLARCSQRVLCTPPRRDGSVHPALLVAAQICGVSSVFKIGGAQAIAALAYGTETLPKVDKIFGPGNAWVTAAKQLVAQDPCGAACDLPAGPSEVLIIADPWARPDFVAADLLAQAEHDALSQAILISDSRPLIEAVSSEIRLQCTALSRHEILSRSLPACRGIVVPDLDTALDLANDYAPEHLMLQVREPHRALARVQNAGSVFLGPWSAETFGDYCTGTNHVLPTYGYARAYSGLSVRDFVKTISVQELTVHGLYELGATAMALAHLEGLDAHANAVAVRLKAALARGPKASIAIVDARP